MKKKRERRQRARQEKQKLEKEWSERDTETMLVTRQSYSQRARQRKSLYFDTMEEAATTLVQIKYTLSILQVYFICTSEKKSTFEVYLVCTSRKKV